LIKTTQAAYPRLEQLIRAAHPYELPEIIAVPVTAGLPAYLDWVNQETNGHGKEAVPENETCHARFPHPNPLGETTSHSTRLQTAAAKSLVTPEGEGANEPLREFRVNALKE